VDVTLRPPGAAAKISDGVERVMQALESNKNKSLKLGDKSRYTYTNKSQTLEPNPRP
jgi:hypothetical protein